MPMSHVLLINPNTSADVTERLVGQLRPWCPPDLPLIGLTAEFGEPYIATEAAYVVAGHAVLEAFHHHVDEHGLPRAVLVGCFGDPAVWALRTEAPEVPVIGLAEAAMREAQAIGPFAIVTGGHAWAPMLERLARGLRLGGPDGLQQVHTVEASGGELAADPEAAQAMLREACLQVARATPRLAAVVLGGAVLGGWAAPIAPLLPCPLIDNVEAGGRWLSRVLGLPAEPGHVVADGAG
ncbi:MAG TPA: aspartate/glutamate racemase family protein [Candidatus Aquabacterium excrementipullorum]|nr:aspartate/glutamate racemase family protein [Candidatus Aquabacterium excrementipullorum]